MLLKLFGGASVETETGPLTGPAAQRRRLGLLARLALAGSQGLRRDKLIAYLWPESETEKARHLLSDSIYRINQALGGEVVVAWGDQLRLDFGLLPCDVVEFEAALERQDLDAAVRLYRGPFLDGFFLDGTLELERWVEDERERLALAYAGALEALAEAAGIWGDHREAVRLWRRLAAHDRLSSRVALWLVEALTASGDRAAALQQARAHEALLREEWGAGPADEFAAAVAGLQVETDRRAFAQPAEVPVANLAAEPEPTPPVGAPEGVAAATGEGSPARAEDSRAPIQHSPAPQRVSRRRPRLMVGAAILVSMLLLSFGLWRANLAKRAPAEPVTVAVLPFADLSPAGDHEYLADGVTEELIAALDKIEGVRVSSRTSAFSLKGHVLDARAAGARLGVAHVIDGSVRREGSRVRIVVQLGDARSGYQLWSAAYERELTGIFAMQEELARAIAGALRVRLGAGARNAAAQTPATNVEAYNLYLRGRYHWHRRTEADLRAAVAAFEDAVRRAPDYGRAWSGLADAYAILGFYDWAPPRDAFPRAREAALRARESDELRGEAEATLAYVNFYHDWNWAAAEEHFRNAIRLEPSSSKARQWYGNFLTGMGRFEEAEREMRAATELEPLSLIANAALCWVMYHAERFEEAVRQCTVTLELEPRFMLAHLWRGWAWGGLERWDSAAVDLEKAVELSGHGTLELAALAYAVGEAGDRKRAAAILDTLRTRAASGYEPGYELAKAALGAGRKAEALQWLERAFADRGHSMAFLKVDPQLASLRGDPRFGVLVEKVGLP